MAKKKEKGLAKRLFIDKLMAQKEIAETVYVTEKTVSNWVIAGNWRQLRDAKLNNSQSRTENIKKVIAELTNMTLQTLEEIKIAEANGDQARLLDLKKETTRISQEVAMYQKALERLEKEFKISLSTYLEVMEDVFEALMKWDKKVYLKTIDFQKSHLQHIAEKLG
ncbi:hypothetical protein EI546_06520 [Aequorivita sp. H23M31]|uniref:DUF1804 family protein n=1 Tax=Aequorivita ciconiae TaxID=2494375 RepID=A0A410G2D0_9FLAO|nr:hypothetical protein [Aequorivita sp. H23M31]QAA81403.1 hypothetical protein EI546_06520 [Aequorivita sp. H23M31]